MVSKDEAIKIVESMLDRFEGEEREALERLVVDSKLYKATIDSLITLKREGKDLTLVNMEKVLGIGGNI